MHGVARLQQSFASVSPRLPPGLGLTTVLPMEAACHGRHCGVSQCFRLRQHPMVGDAHTATVRWPVMEGSRFWQDRGLEEDEMHPAQHHHDYSFPGSGGRL